GSAENPIHDALFRSRPFFNDGTVRWVGGSIDFTNASFTNYGVFQIFGDDTISGYGRLFNTPTGRILKMQDPNQNDPSNQPTPSGATWISVNVVNQGLVDLRAGELWVANADNYGESRIADNATLGITRTMALHGGSTFNGSGLVRIGWDSS